MKTVASKELKCRLANAAANGSVVARDILAELKKNADASEVIRGCANYFSTKRKKQEDSGYQKVKIVFTVCTKDITNASFPDRNNPQAPWFSENRTDVDASTFIGYFRNLPGYAQEDIEYFSNSICVNSKVTVSLYDRMSDFYDAYLGENYTGAAQFGDSSLHNSCMKCEDTSRNAADFYCNFAGAKIIIAKDAENNILGRAIVWEQVVCKGSGPEVMLSVLDRVYFSHTFVTRLIYDYARSIGIQLRKKHNDFSSAGKFVALNDIGEFGISQGMELNNSSLTVKVPATRWHKKGAPYLDTFFSICLSGTGDVYLANAEDSNCFASCRKSSGFAEKKRNICPVCGSIHYLGNDHLCSGCKALYCVETPFGRAFPGKVKKYEGNDYPGFLFEKGRPNRNLKLYLRINKLYED